MSADNRLVDVAAAVGDGAPIDWDLLVKESDAREGEVIRQLRLVERIAALHVVTPRQEASVSPLPMADGAARMTASALAGQWGPLAVGELIGRGTYGEVYRARDTRLDRPVALKLLHRRDAPDHAADAEVIQEAQLLARVRHPGVVTVYGAERIGGRVGIWMELVDGRSLEDELGDRGPLPPDEIIAIGTALSSAVAAVHEAGVLHRDIKAHNVMRGRDGRILLTDFGTGRDITVEGPLTEVIGTPLYLAPELLGGEPASVASDVYSLGVLLYHLATGSYPVSGRTVADLRDAFLADRRTAVLERRPDLPGRLSATIERATDPVPSRRYQSAAALGAALAACMMGSRRMVWLAAAALLVLATVTGLWSKATGGDPAARFVLVGAFDNRTGERRLDDVVQFAFTQELMQARAVTVVPAERIADTLRLMKRADGPTLDLPTALEIAVRDGGIHLVATGRIDRLDSKYVLWAAVNEASTGVQVTQAKVDVGEIDQVLDGVRTLAARIRTGVGDERPQVESESRLARVTTGSLDALRDYTAGVRLIDERRWAAAELRLGDAVRRDPSFASALIMLAHCRRNQLQSADDYLPLAEQALRHAAALPVRERYFIEGSYHQLKEDLPRAIAAYEVLVREQPNDFWGLNNLAMAYAESGRYAAELPLFERLTMLRPNDLSTLVSYAVRLVINGKPMADALAVADRAKGLERPPDIGGITADAWLQLLPAFAAWAEGRVTDAAALLDGLEDLDPASDWHAFFRGQMNLALGRVRAAERAFRQMPDAAEREALLGYAALARGDTAEARAMMTRAVPPLIERLRVTGPMRMITLCWALLRLDLADECRRATHPSVVGFNPPAWLVGELAAHAGDDETALGALQDVVARVPPGDSQYFLAVDTIARLLERRGDLPAAVEALRRLDGVQGTAYPRGGAHGFTWLVARAHLLDLEERLGHRDRVEALTRELEHWLVVADHDFVVRLPPPPFR